MSNAKTSNSQTGTIPELAKAYGVGLPQMHGAIKFLEVIGKAKVKGMAERAPGARGKAGAIYEVKFAVPAPKA